MSDQTATLGGIRWRMTACSECSGTGSQSRQFENGNYRDGIKTVLLTCRACSGRGYARVQIGVEATP